MIRLFLENHEVELNESVIFTLNQQFEDITDPTKIYVEWSKTIKLPVTAANNKLFGAIYCPDRLITTTEGIGIHFDPYKKLDMRLEWGNAVLMQGYAKMLSFNNGYEISLNGELGKVFQEMKNIGFNAEGEYKLADPYSYNINKDLVVSTWKENDLPIGFAPLNVRGSEIDQTVFQVDELSTKTFTEVLTESGFTEDTFATPESVIKDGMMPREIGEYRSYLQQPYIRFKELFKVFQNKAESLTGYEFELDPTWFNENNPYWDKLIYMLKRFDIENTQIKTNQYTFSGYGFRALFWRGDRDPDGNYTDLKSDYFAPGGEQETIPIYNNEVFSLPSNAGNITFSGNIQFTFNKGNQIANNNALMIIIGIAPSVGISRGYKYLIQRNDNYTVEGAQKIFTSTNSFTLPINLATTRREAGPTCQIYINAYWVTNNIPLTNLQPSSMVSFSVDGYMGANLYYNYFRSNAPFGLKDLWDEEYNMFDEILKYCKIHRIGIILEGKKIKFIPFTNYFLDYKIVDWTHKLDKSKDYIIKPITFENKYVKFNYEDNDTKLNEQYKSKHQYNYGEYNLRTQYEFNTETKDLFKGVKTSICNTDNVLSWENLYTNHKIVYSFPAERYVYSKDDDQKYVSCFGQYYFLNGYANWDTEDRLYMRSVGVSDDTLYQRSTDNFCYSQSTNILKCTTYPNIDIQYGSDICLFNKPSETYSYNTYTGNGIYYNFWEQYLNERYNVQNKIVTCYLKLNPIDYITFRFNQFIMIENQLYFVNKIYDYNADSLEPTKVDLITIQDIEGYTRNNYRLFQIYNWYGRLWDPEVDYVLLTYHTEEEKTIYLYSDTDVTWRDKDGTLQDLYINGQNGGGTIQAGSNIPITFKMENNVEAFGKIVFSNGLSEIEVDVRLAQNLIFGLYNANGDEWDSANESIDLSYSKPRQTIYLTSESGVTWSDTSGELQNLYIYEDEDPGNAQNASGSIHSGVMIPVTFEMDVDGHETGSTGSVVFTNGVKSIKVDVTLSDDRSMTVYTWNDEVWDEEVDYIRLERADTSKTIYVTSNTPVTAYDETQSLRSLLVNGEEVNQAVVTIPAGTKVPVEFTMLDDYDESGNIIITNEINSVRIQVLLVSP